MWLADQWKDYEVLDTSNGEKLERWGDYFLVRPDPQVLWDTPKKLRQWKKPNGHYHRSHKGGGQWEFFDLPKTWDIQYKELKFHLQPFSFKHTGLFPEQAVNWDWFSNKIRKANRPVKVLNLFAYTGGATLAAAAAGASVTHVDASKGMVNWAKENAQLSGLREKPIRWLVDDCVKFVEREIRRGNHYDGIIMDPPSYGRGPKGEIWKIEEKIYPFIELCTKILSDDPLFFLVNPPPTLSRNDIIIRMYWDGNDYPSVESPIGPFFGQGWDERYNYASLPLSSGPENGTGMSCYFTMPFEKGARIEIENQSDRNIDAFYFYVDYLEMDKLPKDMGRFHAWYNHNLTEALPEGETEWGLTGEQKPNTTGKDNYVFVETQGKGHFVGINYYVHCPTTMWYGEGDDMWFIDGEKTPSLIGTGTEDFFNTSWCPKEAFSHPYFGYPRVNNDIGWLGRTHVYRFFIADPIFFEKSVKGTIEHGSNNNLTLDLATVAYWYQDSAVALPEAPTKAQRAPKPFINHMDIHRWRDAWRKAKGNKATLWGNE